MDRLRLVLFAGLAVHKLVWEVMKRQESLPASERPRDSRLQALKAVKAAALGGLIAQTLARDVFPIQSQPKKQRGLGLALFGIGLLMAIAGRVHLGRNWANLEDYGVDAKQDLVTHGIYGYVRHPIYAGDLLLLTGLELALNSWLVLGVLVPLGVVLRQTQREEAVLTDSFPAYQSYRERTKRFIPFIF